MKNGFKLTAIIHATPAEIYNTWMSSKGHAAMTGSPAKISGRVGGKFSAWDGYIFGKTHELKPGKRIVQAWRTTEFPGDASDSRLEVTIEKASGGTKITLTHTSLPEEQVADYKQGWEDFYFKPMREYFAGLSS